MTGAARPAGRPSSTQVEGRGRGSPRACASAAAADQQVPSAPSGCGCCSTHQRSRVSSVVDAGQVAVLPPDVDRPEPSPHLRRPAAAAATPSAVMRARRASARSSRVVGPGADELAGTRAATSASPVVAGRRQRLGRHGAPAPGGVAAVEPGLGQPGQQPGAQPRPGPATAVERPLGTTSATRPVPDPASPTASRVSAAAARRSSRPDAVGQLDGLPRRSSNASDEPPGRDLRATPGPPGSPPVRRRGSVPPPQVSAAP